MSVNRAILVGNLGKDPKVSNLNSGDRAVSFTLATTESWKDKNTGERKERSTWHNVVIYNDGLGSVAEKYLKKGSKVYLEGEIQNRKYTDQSGAERYITEIVLQKFRGALVLLSGRDDHDGEQSEPRERQASRSSKGAGSRNTKPSDADMNDDIPF